MKIKYLKFLSLILVALANPSYAVNIGAIGDSLTDEYLYKTDAAAMNWVQILNSVRSQDVNFGSYEASTTERGASRYDGYEYNWAEAGATAREGGMPFDLTIWDAKKQAAGLAQNIQNGDIDVAVVEFGDNDVRFCYLSILFPGLPDCELDAAFEGDVVNSIFDSIDILTTAAEQSGNELSVIISLIGLIPGEDVPNESRTRINALIRDRATVEGILTFTLIDEDVLAERWDADGLHIGELTITDDSADADDLVPEGTPGAGACNSQGMCAGPHHSSHFGADDERGHPNTAVQGLMANEVLKAINEVQGTNIALLSDSEIVALTGHVTDVDIDIDPYSETNEIFPASDNPIVVAIKTTRTTVGDEFDFNALDVNPDSLRFGLGQAHNIAVPWPVDVEGDGDTDVLFAFKTQDAGIFCDDEEVTLFGETYSGEPFAGVDSIQTLDCVDTGCHPPAFP